MNTCQELPLLTSKTTITVPFVYEAAIIKPRCSKPVLACIKDEVTVEIVNSTLDSLPVALKVGEHSMRWDGQSLWAQVVDVVSQEGHKMYKAVHAKEVIKNTENGGVNYRYSCAGPLAPFKNFWSSFSYKPFAMKQRLYNEIKGTGFHHLVSDEELVKKEELKYRLWVDDNRAEVIERLNEIASGLMIVDGLMYQKANEPLYNITTFGAGANFSVGLFITYGYNENLSSRCYFNALEFEKAKEFYLDKTPNKEHKIRTNCGNIIEVLIPEAVQCKPELDHPE